MSEPSKKVPVLEISLDQVSVSIFGRSRTASIKADVCVICGKPATEFKDALSKIEYGISGMCQACQDGAFK